MLLAAWASTRPTTGDREQPVVDGDAELPAAATASRPPISPDQMVIGNTAARVMTSHLPTVSSGRDSGGFAVSRISFQPSRRSRSVMGVSTVVFVGGGAHAAPRGSENVRAGMYHVLSGIRRVTTGG